MSTAVSLPDPSIVGQQSDGARHASRVVDGFTELLDEVDSEEIASKYDIGLHSNRIGFIEHTKIGLWLSIANPKTLEDLAQQTDVRANLEPISKGHFSKLTNRRPSDAIAELAIAVLEHPSVFRGTGLIRKRLQHALDRQIVGIDATNLPLRTTLVIDREEDDDPIIVRPEHGGIRLHTAARLDPAAKHPLTLSVTSSNYHETRVFDSLLESVEADDTLESVILTFDMGYVDYDRFGDLKRSGPDFVTPLKSNARYDVVEQLSEFDDEDVDEEEVHVTDEMIELSKTGDVFRKVTVRHADRDDEVYLTTLPVEEFGPWDVVMIYRVRWLIEILYRELKQYTNVQEFHSKTLNGALFELYCALLAYLLVDYYRQQYYLKGGMAAAFKHVHNYWDEPIGEYG